MDKAELGSRIREARLAKGYTQEALAEIADVGLMYYGEVERGIKMPSMKTFIKILNALDVSADFILRNELVSGKPYVMDDITKRLDKLSPQQRKAAVDILDAYIKNLQ